MYPLKTKKKKDSLQNYIKYVFNRFNINPVNCAKNSMVVKLTLFIHNVLQMRCVFVHCSNNWTDWRSLFADNYALCCLTKSVYTLYRELFVLQSEGFGFKCPKQL